MTSFDHHLQQLEPRSLFGLRSIQRESLRRDGRAYRSLMIGRKTQMHGDEAVMSEVVQSAAGLPDVQDISFLNDWCDRIFVMTIPRNEAGRMAQTRHTLSSLRYDVYHAVDQRDYTRDQLDKMLRDLGSVAPNWASPAMIAHSIGFLRLLHHIVKNKIERTLFIEDDFALAPYGRLIFRNALRELQSPPINDDWDLVHFHSHLPCTPADSSLPGGMRPLFYPKIPGAHESVGLTWDDWVEKAQAEPDRVYPFHQGREYIPDANGGFLQYVFRGYRESLSTLCLAISYNGAKELVRRSVEWQSSDRLCGLLSVEPDHRAFIVSPFPCHPQPTATSFHY